MSRTNDEEIMLQGTGHTGQPHAALDLPGASSLDVLTTAITDNGNTLFSTATSPFSIFKITSSGELLKTITEDVVIQVKESFFREELESATVLGMLGASTIVPLDDGGTSVIVPLGVSISSPLTAIRVTSPDTETDQIEKRSSTR